MNISSSHIIHKFIAILLALNIFNNSVDSIDPVSHGLSEDLSFNDIESVSELVAEIIFLFDNASIELEDNDAESNEANVKEEIEYHSHNKNQSARPQLWRTVEKSFLKLPDLYSHQYHPEISPPPPKA
jgi:hypothetical protein